MHCTAINCILCLLLYSRMHCPASIWVGQSAAAQFSWIAKIRTNHRHQSSLLWNKLWIYLFYIKHKDSRLSSYVTLWVPPWNLKRGGLDSSGPRLNCSIGKTKVIYIYIYFFFIYFFFLKERKRKRKNDCFYIFWDFLTSFDNYCCLCFFNLFFFSVLFGFIAFIIIIIIIFFIFYLFIYLFFFLIFWIFSWFLGTAA